MPRKASGSSGQVRRCSRIIWESPLIPNPLVIVRKDMRLTWPRGETPTHWIAMGTDRDLTVAGRHSKKYYAFAQQWLWGEFIFNKQRKHGNHPLRLAKAAANIGIGKLGMRMTAKQVEA